MSDAQTIPVQYSTAIQSCMETNHQVKSELNTSGGVVGMTRAITAPQGLPMSVLRQSVTDGRAKDLHEAKCED